MKHGIDMLQTHKPNPAEVIESLYRLAEENPASAHTFITQAKKLEEQYGLSTLPEEWLKKFITQDKLCKELKDKVRKLYPVDDPVLIQGETGTGKEILANALHGARKGPFVAINCAGMPTELIESELFGYAAGSFTGAKSTGTPGLIRTANNGTLFLDEIGDLPLSAQAKLLRVLQEKKVRPVGGVEDISVSVRIIAATHHSLENHIKEGLFRRDLYARLQTFILYIPPLRTRLPDVSLILQSLDTNSTFPFDKFQVTRDYPNNVRDVQAIYRRWYVFGELC